MNQRPTVAAINPLEPFFPAVFSPSAGRQARQAPQKRLQNNDRPTTNGVLIRQLVLGKLKKPLVSSGIDRE